MSDKKLQYRNFVAPVEKNKLKTNALYIVPHTLLLYALPKTRHTWLTITASFTVHCSQLPRWVTFNFKSATKALIIMSILPFPTMKKKIPESPKNRPLCSFRVHANSCSCCSEVEQRNQPQNWVRKREEVQSQEVAAFVSAHSCTQYWTTAWCSDWESPCYWFINTSAQIIQKETVITCGWKGLDDVVYNLML